MDDWRTVNLTSLGAADTLTFSYESSDVGVFGINTPTYFAADDLVLSTGSNVVPEPSSIVCFLVVAIGLGMLRWRRRWAD